MLTASVLKLQYVPLSGMYLPDFPITHIGVSIPFARKFLAYPNCAFNMLLPMLIGPMGTKFMRQLRILQRPITVWTVNDKALMAWAIKHDLDGVISDDPKTYLDLCKHWDEARKKRNLSVKLLFTALWMQILVFILGPWFYWWRSNKSRRIGQTRTAT